MAHVVGISIIQSRLIIKEKHVPYHKVSKYICNIIYLPHEKCENDPNNNYLIGCVSSSY